MVALFGLLRDQLAVLASSAPTPANNAFLTTLLSEILGAMDDPPTRIRGVSADFVDSLDRVDKKTLAKSPEDTCPICAETFLDDEYPLVVRLPCHRSHRFDLECIQPWLRSQGTCPLCKADFAPKPKEVVEKSEQDEDEDDDEMGMFG